MLFVDEDSTRYKLKKNFCFRILRFVYKGFIYTLVGILMLVFLPLSYILCAYFYGVNVGKECFEDWLDFGNII